MSVQSEERASESARVRILDGLRELGVFGSDKALQRATDDILNTIKRFGHSDLEQKLKEMLKLSKADLAMYLLDESAALRKGAEIILKEREKDGRDT